LLMKSGSDAQPLSARAQARSAATGRSLAQIAAAQDAAWESHRPVRVKPSAPSPNPQTVRAGENLKGLPRATPRFVEPMKALLVKNLPNGANWNFEIKFDGVRALAIKQSRKLALRSRADKNLRLKYQPIAAALEKLPVGQVVLDGEIVAVDQSGRSAFQLLQSYQSSPGPKPRLLYYVFDILNLEGRDLTGLPLWQRKQMAERLVLELQPEIRFSASIHADSARVVREMRKRGLEGLVAKLRDSRYEPGRRSGAWVKFKWTLEQEFVIGGYTEPKGARSHFGALLVGYYQDRRLLFAAKVGTGFDERGLTELHGRLQQLRTKACPFSNVPAKGGLTSAGMRRCTWVEPKLVCQVRFSEWTRDGHLRQPAFLGLREDKEPREVSREVAQ
ncbi:MAG TPA: non-homologous end-joining DNA ligase, partial [Verrucomicrobiae bacterium]|nr:non-homologous end-joining DNA ligase [Verrucomicrobiae bacterium]